ncbi:hypothetical protein PRZ48_004612 [Zasmidium cellare]|uniref:F-box domain-containing protein n=1 Tax=Zasmidium cellare TaxID=395010 RepID=A0ABR0EQA5_ZASCE|nr:hypothetical protein PRZ48_004612 [Zasmidium cellare]
MATDTTAPKVFRFLDLPPEIRCYIYTYAFRGPSLRGTFFRFPALIRVSRLVRNESLPIFFARNNFILDVGTNFMALENPDPASLLTLRRRRELEAGTLLFKSAVSRFLTATFDYVLFRNITFHVHPMSKLKRQRHAEHSHDEAIFAITLRVSRGNISSAKVAASGGHPIINQKTYTKRERKMCDFMVDCVLSEAKVVEARKDFKGFKLRDLKDIAFACRFHTEGGKVWIDTRRNWNAKNEAQG